MDNIEQYVRNKIIEEGYIWRIKKDDFQAWIRQEDPRGQVSWSDFFQDIEMINDEESDTYTFLLRPERTEVYRYLLAQIVMNSDVLAVSAQDLFPEIASREGSFHAWATLLQNNIIQDFSTDPHAHVLRLAKTNRETLLMFLIEQIRTHDGSWTVDTHTLVQYMSKLGGSLLLLAEYEERGLVRDVSNNMSIFVFKEGKSR